MLPFLRPLSHHWLIAFLVLLPSSFEWVISSWSPGLPDVSPTPSGTLVAYLPGFSLAQSAEISEQLKQQQFLGRSPLAKQSDGSITELPSFAPSQYGFRFNNQAMADAITQSLHARDEESYDEYQVQTLTWFFNPSDVCLMGETPDDCLLKLAAERWLREQLASMEYGVCDGIAAASLYFWDYAVSGETRNYTYTTIEDIFGDRDLNASQLELDNLDLQDYTTDLFLSQNMRQVYLRTAAVRQTHSPNQILDDLIASMQADQPDPYTLGIYQLSQDGNGQIQRHSDGSPRLGAGHSIVPYAIADQGNGIFWVYVYDNNYDVSFHEQNQLKVVFDTTENRWFYQPEPNERYEGGVGDRNIDLTRLSWRNLGEGEYYECPFCDTTDVEVSMVGNALLNSPDFDRVRVENQITARSGLGHVLPPTYYLPARAEPYSLVVSNPHPHSAEAALSVSGNDFVVGFETFTLEAGQQFDVLLYKGDQGVSIYFSANDNHRAPVTIPTLYITAEDRLEGDDSGTAYSFEISGLQLDPGKEVGFTLNLDQNALYFGDTNTQPDDYQLHVKRLDSRGEVWLDVSTTLEASEIGRFQYNQWQWVPESWDEGVVEEVPEEAIPLQFYDGYQGEPLPEVWLEGDIHSRPFQSDPARVGRGSNRAEAMRQAQIQQPNVP